MDEFVAKKLRGVRSEIAALEGELKAARTEIKQLRRTKGDVPACWHIDFRATPFYADATPGATLDLYPLFKIYHQQTRGSE